MSAEISCIHIRGKAALAVNMPADPAPSGWAWVPLNLVARQETGHTPSRSHPEWWGGEVPWIGLRDARLHHGGTIFETQQTINSDGLANSSARLLPQGTVCLSRTASVGYVVMMGREMATSQDFVTWTCSDALVPEFLMKALIAEGEDIRKFGKGTTHTTIYFPEVRAFHICLPPLAEQKRIVAKLDALNAKSTRARTELARIETLVARYKQAVLGKAFSGELEQLELGRLVSRIKAGKNLRCEERPPRADESGVVKVSAVTWGEFRADQSKTLPSDFEPDTDTRIKFGDFLFSRANTVELVGAVVIVKEDPINLFLSDKILRLEFREPVDNWILWYLRSPMGRNALMSVSSGNQLSMRNIGQANLLSLLVPYANEVVRNEIVRRIESAFARIDRLAAEAKRALDLLGKLDEAILAKAFRGELVPQDENDEPAEQLLARIRAERAAAPKAKRGRRKSA